MNYTERIPIPRPEDINTGHSYAKQSTMIALLGKPRPKLCEDCQPITGNEKLKDAIVTASVGPFRVTGHKVAIESLKRIFQNVKAEKPDLYKLLGTAGMLCARAVRGSKTNWSNHSWGCAIDITIGGVLDNVDDGKCLRGLLERYRYFHAEGWFWGSEFSREDSMHFELSDETARRLFG